MSKILFITTRNVLNTSGELRLIKNRSKALYDKWGIQTDFLVITSKKKAKMNSEKVNIENTTVITMNSSNPIDYLWSYNKCSEMILRQIKSGVYKAVVLSGIGTLQFVQVIKKSNKDMPVIADIHGANEDIKEFSKGKSFFKKLYLNLLYHYSRYSESKYLSKMDGIFVVSTALSEYLANEFSLSNLKYYVVPCAIDSRNIKLQERDENRKKYREKYNIKSDETLFIYSGGVSPWQCIETSIKIFKNLHSTSEGKYKMLILSHHIEKIIPLLKDCKGIITDRADSSEVNNILCAGDYGFLIRENMVTNNVAYPNKFLEYVQSGMKIITTPFVYDVVNQLKKFDLGLFIDPDDKYEKELLNYINKTNYTDNSENRKHLLHKTSFEETLKGFVKDFKFNE